MKNDYYFRVARVSSMGQLLLDNERAMRKLSKVRLRRDHYARLYFQTLSQLEETKWKLSRAMNTIRELKTQGIDFGTTPYKPRLHEGSNPDLGSSVNHHIRIGI